MELQCKVQNYEWGKMGEESMVATLIKSGGLTSTIDPDTPYAELWLSTHPNGPSLIIDRDVMLSEYLKDNLDAIGPVVQKQFGVAVPFILKVLSIRKALSIQAHPNKKHAEELHKTFPEIYKDPNHKPELAIALTPFEALCGFRPMVQIKEYLKSVPELTEILANEAINNLINNEDEEDSHNVLKNVFKSLMTCEKNAIASSLTSFLSRLEKSDDVTRSKLQYSVVKRLHTDFPGDVGCWAIYFMNYLQLNPGQAIFLKSNLPHAYLSGDCVECMACSDNVVRAGLTPKLIDVERLVEMLDYGNYSTDQLLFTPEMEDPNSCIWRPPVPDFAVVKIRVESGDSYNTLIRASPSLILITSGEGQACDTEPIAVRPGVAIFLKANRQLTLTPAHGSHIEAYQGICNV